MIVLKTSFTSSENPVCVQFSLRGAHVILSSHSPKNVFAASVSSPETKTTLSGLQFSFSKN